LLLIEISLFSIFYSLYFQKMTLQKRDQKYLWHPYTQQKTSKPAIAITKGMGALLWDENDKEYIDAIASWWVNPYGHSNQYIADAIYKQLTTIEHVLFGGFTHEPAVLLSEKLMGILPKNQQKLFFSDNGSTAVEIAIKVALQYFYNKGEKRTTIIAFENAFHGDTFAAMATSGISFFTEAFQGMLIDVIRIPVPVKGKEEASFLSLAEAIKNHNCAGFIFEPLVQGAAGMVMYEPEALDNLMAICKENQVLTIADEVMTGFGKTGKNFACDFLTKKPDMMCLSKALTGGTIPMAITTFTQEIFDAFYDDDINKALFHGHTFTANPTGCVAALASLELLQTHAMQENIARVNKNHLEFRKQIQSHPKVKTTRVLGVIFALEIKTENSESYYGTLRNKLYDFFIENGVVLRPVGNIIYILPPYVITDEQLQKVYEVVEKALNIV
jgi:adenosylmethionine---8-amino-7-oxononanoate aminotransferase